MSEKNQFEVKNPFTVRLTAEEHQIFQESVIDIMPDAEPEDINNRKLLVRLIDLAISKGKKIFVQRPEDLATIQNLTNEIGRLKIEIDLKNEAFENANKLRIEADENFYMMKEEMIKAPAAQVITADQQLITIPPVVAKVLEIEAATAKKKTGKDFNFGDLLLNSFWESVTVGRAFPWRTWSSSELAKIANDLKAAQ